MNSFGSSAGVLTGSGRLLAYVLGKGLRAIKHPRRSTIPFSPGSLGCLQQFFVPSERSRRISSLDSVVSPIFPQLKTPSLTSTRKKDQQCLIGYLGLRDHHVCHASKTNLSKLLESGFVFPRNTRRYAKSARLLNYCQ